MVLVQDGNEQPGDEKLNNKWWRVEGPIDIENADVMKYHCVSYVWGSGREKRGELFNSKIEISDQTRPALEASLRAADTLYARSELPSTPAFWIDAICVPQEDGPARYGSLESMGWIYRAAESVIIVLQEPTWRIIKLVASTPNSPDALSEEEMEILEHDKWISSVWTYQESINCSKIFFTTASPEGNGDVIPANSFFNCVGFSLDQWKKAMNQPTCQTLSRFPNLNALEDTLADRQMVGYLELPALSILSNMTTRRFDVDFPKNRILASLGVVHKEVSWGKPSTTIDELAEKFMLVCEAKNDYSFIFTSDERDETHGLRWRPRAKQIGNKSLKPAHLVPIVSFYGWSEPFGEMQGGRRDSEGLWLETMAPVSPCVFLNRKALEHLELWLYGTKDPTSRTTSNTGFFGWNKGVEDISGSMFMALKSIGFTGSSASIMCESGMFFCQISLDGKEGVEIFVSTTLRWMFGAPGLARWKEGEIKKYSAGVFTGIVDRELAKPLLLD